MRPPRSLVLVLALLAVAPATAAAAQDPSPPQEAPKPAPAKRRPPVRRPARPVPADTAKAKPVPAPSAPVPSAPTSTPAAPPSAPAVDSARAGAGQAPPPPVPVDTARPAGAPTDSAGAGRPATGDLAPLGIALPAPAHDATGRRDDEAPPARPRGAWRVGVGAISTISRLLIVNDGVNADVAFSGGPAVLLEGEFRVLGPIRLYATAGAAQGQVNHSNALANGLRPPRPTYGGVVGLGSAGLLLQPTFGGAVLQPYLRGGAGMKGYVFDFPGNRRFAATPAVDVGAGLRLHGGRIGGFLEGRWLRSVFPSTTLPAPLVPRADVVQHDLLVAAGIRVTR